MWNELNDLWAARVDSSLRAAFTRLSSINSRAPVAQVSMLVEERCDLWGRRPRSVTKSRYAVRPPSPASCRRALTEGICILAERTWPLRSQTTIAASSSGCASNRRRPNPAAQAALIDVQPNNHRGPQPLMVKTPSVVTERLAASRLRFPDAAKPVGSSSNSLRFNELESGGGGNRIRVPMRIIFGRVASTRPQKAIPPANIDPLIKRQWPRLRKGRVSGTLSHGPNVACLLLALLIVATTHGQEAQACSFEREWPILEPEQITRPAGD